MRSVICFLVFFGGIFATSLPAAWWWPFGDDDDWKTMPRAQQDKAAVEFMNQAELSYSRGNRGDALSSYKKVYKNYPGSRYAQEALYQTGLIQMERRKWRKAFEAFQSLIQRYPDFPQFDDLIGNQFTCATSLAEGINTHYLFFIPYRNFERAVQYYEQLIANAPYSDYAPLALMNVANIHRYKREPAEAIDALDRLINSYPQSLLAPDAYLNLADTFASLVDGPLYDQGATREAISYYQDFLILYPESPLVRRGEEGLREVQEVYADSKYVLGNYYYRHRDYFPGAKVFLNETITTAPNSLAAEKARALLAKIEEIEASRPQPQLIEGIVRQKRSWWSRFWFWNSESSDDAQPAPATDNADHAAPDSPTTAPETPVQPEKKRSFWDRMKFWESDEDEDSDEDDSSENSSSAS